MLNAFYNIIFCIISDILYTHTWDSAVNPLYSYLICHMISIDFSNRQIIELLGVVPRNLKRQYWTEVSVQFLTVFRLYFFSSFRLSIRPSVHSSVCSSACQSVNRLLFISAMLFVCLPTNLLNSRHIIPYVYFSGCLCPATRELILLAHIPETDRNFLSMDSLIALSARAIKVVLPQPDFPSITREGY